MEKLPWRKRQMNLAKTLCLHLIPRKRAPFPLWGRRIYPRSNANIYFPFNFLRSSAGRRGRRPLQIILLFYANKYILRNFVRSSAGGRLPPLRYTHYFAQANIFSVILYALRRTVGGSDGSATKWEERLERVAAVSRGRGGLPTKANAGYRNRTAGPYR